MSYNRTILERASRKLQAAGSLNSEVKLTGEEAEQIASWMRNEKYRGCKRKHIENLEKEGRLRPILRR